MSEPQTAKKLGIVLMGLAYQLFTVNLCTYGSDITYRKRDQPISPHEDINIAAVVLFMVSFFALLVSCVCSIPIWCVDSGKVENKLLSIGLAGFPVLLIIIGLILVGSTDVHDKPISPHPVVVYVLSGILGFLGAFAMYLSEQSEMYS